MIECECCKRKFATWPEYLDAHPLPEASGVSERSIEEARRRRQASMDGTHRLSAEEIAQRLAEVEGLKMSNRSFPRVVCTFFHLGTSYRVVEVESKETAGANKLRYRAHVEQSNRLDLMGEPVWVPALSDDDSALVKALVYALIDSLAQYQPKGRSEPEELLAKASHDPYWEEGAQK